jgi:VanZ family protein
MNNKASAARAGLEDCRVGTVLLGIDRMVRTVVEVRCDAPVKLQVLRLRMSRTAHAFMPWPRHAATPHSKAMNQTALLSPLRRIALVLADALTQPSRPARFGAAALAALLVVNVLWQGAQPYAVGLVPGGWDKLAHATLHAVLCTCLLFSLGLRRGLAAVLSCAAFAALDEFAQYFSPGRSVSVMDWLASVAGAGAAWAGAHALVASVARRPA